LGIALAFFLLLCPSLSAQNSNIGANNLRTGRDIYLSGCVGCHGPDGKGMPQTTVGFEKPDTFPDFSRCDQTTPEFDIDYKAVIRDGGRARGFSRIMPSFGGILSLDQINKLVAYLRSFCREKGWPRGELNFPRALATEKAYPEDEVVLTTAVNAQGLGGVNNEFVYEHSFLKTYQLEISAPFSFLQQDTGRWFGGLGDASLGLKKVFIANLNTGSILGVQGGVHFPSGNQSRGFGTGTTVFEVFTSYDQALPASSFVQLQMGAELPKDTMKAPQSVFGRAAIGKNLRQGQGLGRLWVPMTEFVFDRDLETGARTNFDLLPEFQVTLNKRQHVRADIGVQIPVTNTAGRSVQVVFYVLWDWFDGKIQDGWK
jgi:cytochrome c553